MDEADEAEVEEVDLPEAHSVEIRPSNVRILDENVKCVTDQHGVRTHVLSI